MIRSMSWQCVVAVLGATLLVVVVGSKSSEVLAHPKGYVFTPLVFLGDPTPRGGAFLDVFESNIISNRGDALFGSNVALGYPPRQGLFLLRKGEISAIARAGERAPGGGVYDFGFLSPTTLNDKGDAAFAFLLSPFSFPAGMNAGVSRFSQITRTGAPVMRPGVTPARGGGVFKGAPFGVSLNNRRARASPRGRLEEAPSKDVRRRTGAGYEVWHTKDGQARDHDVLSIHPGGA